MTIIMFYKVHKYWNWFCTSFHSFPCKCFYISWFGWKPGKPLGASIVNSHIPYPVKLNLVYDVFCKDDYNNVIYKKKKANEL